MEEIQLTFRCLFLQYNYSCSINIQRSDSSERMEAWERLKLDRQDAQAMMAEDRVVSLCSFFENQVKYRPTLEAEKGCVGDDTGENIRVQLYVSTESLIQRPNGKMSVGVEPRIPEPSTAKPARHGVKISGHLVQALVRHRASIREMQRRPDSRRLFSLAFVGA